MSLRDELRRRLYRAPHTFQYHYPEFLFFCFGVVPTSSFLIFLFSLGYLGIRLATICVSGFAIIMIFSAFLIAILSDP